MKPLKHSNGSASALAKCLPRAIADATVTTYRRQVPFVFVIESHSMLLGIRATVDFVFKMIFGSPKNSQALIGLLNAILELDEPIVDVEILNPFSYQEFADNKLIVLDVRCRDRAGRLLNVEMQVSIIVGLQQRMVYYACNMYSDQISAGDNYAALRPAISICLLTGSLFDGPQAHHRFQMVDVASGRELSNAIEVHTVELAKYNLSEATITQAPKIQQWAFLLLFAHQYDSATLRRLLPGIEFEQAITTIETISAKTEDRLMYDQREKAQRDYDWMISGAQQAARAEGLAKGREEGREAGREEGKLTGKIQVLQELLGETISSDAELIGQDLPLLTKQFKSLQERLRKRSV